MPTPFARALADLAEDQFRRFELFDENDDVLGPQIRRYWEEIGLDFPGVGTAWSAVFVSWCMRTAGAAAREFEVSSAHARFVHWAIGNARRETGLFRARPIAERGPLVGDVIHWNRDGGTVDFAFAAGHKRYNSHSAIVLETGEDSLGRFALTVGGNESDSVRRQRIALDANGLVKQRQRNPFISVIEKLK
ncbi:MAG: DUF2272 domain-containing protein [Alphaproteobacteria bacterium]